MLLLKQREKGLSVVGVNITLGRWVTGSVSSIVGPEANQLDTEFCHVNYGII